MEALTLAAIADRITADLGPSTTVLDALARYEIAPCVGLRDGATDEQLVIFHRLPALPRLKTRAFFLVLPSLMPGASMAHMSELALWAIAAEQLRRAPGWELDPEGERAQARAIAAEVIARRGPLAPIRDDERSTWMGMVRTALADRAS